MAPPCGLGGGMETVQLTVQFRLMIYIFRHSRPERFTVSELLGIHCPGQGRFASINECGTD